MVMEINAASARASTSRVREELAKADIQKMSKRVDAAINRGEYETYVDFSLLLKEEVLKLLETQGFKTISSGNVAHNGRYQIKISWK